MDNSYMKALSIVEDTLSRISSLYNNAKLETFEEVKCCKATEKLIEDLEEFIRDIRHYSKTTQEGYLQLNSNGRYELKGIELICGSPMEVYNPKYKEWQAGRVEHSSKHGGYYFYNYDGDDYLLAEGFKVRIRK